MTWSAGLDLFAADQNPGDPQTAKRLMASYRAQMTIDDTELASLELFVTLHHAIQAAWKPTGLTGDSR